MSPVTSHGDQLTADELLSVVGNLVDELHPTRRRRLHIALDSDLDRNLGFDSLGRAELLLRLEKAFKLHLPERLLGEAATPRDLLAAVLAAKAPGASAPVPQVAALELEPAPAAPASAQTLTEVLDWHVAVHPDRTHALFAAADGTQRPFTYDELAKGAKAVARGLRARGVEEGDRVAIMLPSGVGFFAAFFGALYAGGVPVPIYPPLRPAQIEEHLRRQAGILGNAGARVLVTVAEARPLGALLRAQVESLAGVATVDELESAGPPGSPSFSESAPPLPAVTRGAALALLQYTSGSTGEPKGVMLSHANLLANIRAMGEVMGASSEDVFVSWLPLYHDLGLIGAWLGSLYYAVPVVIMSPLDFLMRPARWLWAIHRNRATLTAAPNFAFELCLTKIDDAAIEGLDLSSLRMVANGAEPVSPATIRRFIVRFAKYGFKPGAMAPAYGLAESAVGLAVPPLGRPPLIDRVERRALSERGEATPARPGDPTALEFVSCGRPLPDHEIRLIDETGREVGERCEGRLQFRGPSATTGYFRNPEKTHELFDGDWLDSGDRAYMAGGEVFITGRVKDIIIRAGHNIYPQALEEAVGEIEGVRKGCVAIFASADPRSGTERIVIMAETSETDSAKRDALIQTVSEVATDLLGMPPDDVVLAPPDSVPKTASGKLRRAAARARYEAGSVDARPRALWQQIARLTLAGLGARTWRLARTTRARAYAGYWWAVLYGIGAVVWPLTLLMPSRAWRWGLVHAAARLGLRLMGIRLAVTGLENLPEGGVIVVANHASYFDAMVLAAALPEVPTFTAKAELAPQIVAGPFLRRIGTLFVERWTAERGVEQTREAAALAAEGACLMFFPEGTLSRHPGLGEFHLGAFVAAAEVGVPVVPIAIRGTRSILRGGQWFPRHGAVNLTIFAPIRPEGRGFEVALKLREVARAEILAQCGEPDLAEQPAQPQPTHAERPARMLG